MCKVGLSSRDASRRFVLPPNNTVIILLCLKGKIYLHATNSGRVVSIGIRLEARLRVTLLTFYRNASRILRLVRDDLFDTNASIVKGIAEQCAKSCPKACFLIISNPVNSIVPLFAEVLKVLYVHRTRT